MCFSDVDQLSEGCPMDITHAIDHLCSYFAIVEDPRRQHPTTFHALEAILLITILGTICGAQNWVEIEQWGQTQKTWLSEFLELPHGMGVALKLTPLQVVRRPSALESVPEGDHTCGLR